MKKAIKAFLSHHKDLQEICRPLFYKTPVFIVNYIRVYKENQKASYLCDNYHWLHNYLNGGYYHKGEFENNKSFWERDYVLWDSLSDDDPVVVDSRKNFNVYAGVTLVNDKSDYLDFFNFATSLKNQEEVLRSMEHLTNFRQEFYDKAKKLLIRSKENLLPVAPEKASETPGQQIKDNRLYLGPKYDYNYLTATEQKVISFLAKGLSHNGVAQLLNLSPRTIEKHMENVKRKLGCSTQFEMGFILKSLLSD